MKKLTIIFTLILVISAVLFGISIPIFGVYSNEEIIASGKVPTDTDKKVDYSEEYDNINIYNTSAKLKVTLSKDNDTHISFTNNRPGRTLYTNIENGTLEVSEQNKSFLMFSIAWGGKSEIKIELPEKQYKKFKLVITSGEADVSDINCEDMEVHTTSGDVNINGYGKNIKANTLSGSVKIKNNTNEKINNLVSYSTSGDVSFDGFETNSFNVETLSGSASLSGISGKGNLYITSGNVYLNYKNWDDDLKIQATSGDIDVKLPEKSGALVTFNGTSGGVGVELGENKIRCEKNSTTQIAGENSHKIDIRLTSGYVKIRDN